MKIISPFGQITFNAIGKSAFTLSSSDICINKVNLKFTQHFHLADTRWGRVIWNPATNKYDKILITRASLLDYSKNDSASQSASEKINNWINKSFLPYLSSPDFSCRFLEAEKNSIKEQIEEKTGQIAGAKTTVAYLENDIKLLKKSLIALG